ncbi:MAG TPA: hypothetical protein VJ953_16470 [Saprospiraceae bacterium]|nr:hypothetical protein [Saprospiraceae bacterium]
MESFADIKKHCQDNSRFTPLIDKFLIYYAAERERLEPKMDRKLKQYKQVARQIPTPSLNIFKSEYITLQLFKKGGLIGKYLNHSTIKALGKEEFKYLSYQYAHPWRLSFAIIREQPAEDFYQMYDIFRDEEYLLYSPGMSRTLDEYPARLWCNLISYNGQCWQTYGVIMGWQSFTTDDIFFFATELHPEIETDAELLRAAEKDPWPFFMLITGSTLPQLDTQGEPMVYLSAEDELEELPYEPLKELSELRWKEDVYEISLEAWSGPPHFANAYYDEKEKLLFRYAATKTGYVKMTELLQQTGLTLDPEPHIRLSPGMRITIEKILGRDVTLNPYDAMFFQENPQTDEEIDKINHLLQLAMPLINNNEVLDTKKLAAEAKVDLELARELLRKAEARIKKLRDGH